MAFAIVAGLCFGSASTAPASAERPDMPPLPHVAPSDKPGLALTIESLAPGAAKLTFHDTRTARMFALYVPANQSPSSFAPPGPFRATFEGDITLRLRDSIGFFAQGRGKLTLKINDRAVLENSGDFPNQPSSAIRLNKGKNHVLAVYESPVVGDTMLRMFWVPRGQMPEPIPPTVLSHDASAPAMIEGERVRTGRFLIAQFRCTKCHDSGISAQASVGQMPELAQDAPSLAGIGSRLNEQWLAAWIDNPRAMRNRVHMPRLFSRATDDTSIDPRARDIAAYLATLRSGEQSPEAPAAEKAEAGGRVFAKLNCVACHIAPDRAQAGSPEADSDRISFEHVPAKFRPGALVRFLLKPEAHYAWIEMPNFRLSQEETESLAAFLLSAKGKPTATVTGGDAVNGQKLLRSSGCLNCHSVDDQKSGAENGAKFIALDKIPKAGWSRGCMAASAENRKNAPDFSLSDDQRNAIVAFAATDRTSLARDSAPEFAERQIAALRCTACHARDGKESLLATVLDAENQELGKRFPPAEAAGQEGIAPDQRAPMLTWAGEKLRPDWTNAFIEGQIAYKPRPYLRARMPGFPARAKVLALGLALEHGCSPTDAPYPPADAKLAEIGRQLAGKAPSGSFSCVQCHPIANQPALAPFEAPALNFMHVTDRLRQDYYYRWLHNPLRIDPESKMPRFDDDEGKTQITTVLEGDARKQFEAMWNYMRAGKEIKPPEE